jgi:hypothetical protein
MPFPEMLNGYRCLNALYFTLYSQGRKEHRLDREELADDGFEKGDASQMIT